MVHVLSKISAVWHVTYEKQLVTSRFSSPSLFSSLVL